MSEEKQFLNSKGYQITEKEWYQEKVIDYLREYVNFFQRLINSLDDYIDARQVQKTYQTAENNMDMKIDEEIEMLVKKFNIPPPVKDEPWKKFKLQRTSDVFSNYLPPIDETFDNQMKMLNSVKGNFILHHRYYKNKIEKFETNTQKHKKDKRRKRRVQSSLNKSLEPQANLVPPVPQQETVAQPIQPAMVPSTDVPFHSNLENRSRDGTTPFQHPQFQQNARAPDPYARMDSWRAPHAQRRHLGNQRFSPYSYNQPGTSDMPAGRGEERQQYPQPGQRHPGDGGFQPNNQGHFYQNLPFNLMHGQGGPAQQYRRGSPAQPYVRGSPAQPYVRGSPAQPYVRGSPAQPYVRGSPAQPYVRGSPAQQYERGSPAQQQVPPGQMVMNPQQPRQFAPNMYGNHPFHPNVDMPHPGYQRQNNMDNREMMGQGHVYPAMMNQGPVPQPFIPNLPNFDNQYHGYGGNRPPQQPNRHFPY